jgi:hypothetical protein
MKTGYDSVVDNREEGDKSRVFHLSRDIFLDSMVRIVERYGKKILRLNPYDKKVKPLVKLNPPLEKTAEDAVFWTREFLKEYIKRKKEKQISYKEIIMGVKKKEKR